MCIRDSNLLTRILLLKIYFDKADWEALEHSLETFRIYLLRHKNMTDNRRKSGLNLLRFTKMLMHLFSERQLYTKRSFRQQISLLKAKIERKKMVLNKPWLLSKLEDEV